MWPVSERQWGYNKSDILPCLCLCCLTTSLAFHWGLIPWLSTHFTYWCALRKALGWHHLAPQVGNHGLVEAAYSCVSPVLTGSRDAVELDLVRPALFTEFWKHWSPGKAMSLLSLTLCPVQVKTKAKQMATQCWTTAQENIRFSFLGQQQTSRKHVHLKIMLFGDITLYVCDTAHRLWQPEEGEHQTMTVVSRIFTALLLYPQLQNPYPPSKLSCPLLPIWQEK